jgi:hypothetical protein
VNRSIDQALPLSLAAAFVVVVQGLSLAEFLPAPVAVLIGAGWAFVIGRVALAVKRRLMLSAWVEGRCCICRSAITAVITP